jgi:hypothetical protein
VFGHFRCAERPDETYELLWLPVSDLSLLRGLALVLGAYDALYPVTRLATVLDE